MSPRAAWRLEAAGFGPVYDYQAGKIDWIAADLPFEGTAQLAGMFTRRGVATTSERATAAEALRLAGCSGVRASPGCQPAGHKAARGANGPSLQRFGQGHDDVRPKRALAQYGDQLTEGLPGRGRVDVVDPLLLNRDVPDDDEDCDNGNAFQLQ